MPYKDPEKRKEYERQYRQNNKERREYLKKYHKEYQQTPAGKKSHVLAHWKQRGLIHDNYEELYKHYIQTDKCDVCKKEFTEKNWRCMDHDHDTGLFRHILCNNCNSYDRWKKIK